MLIQNGGLFVATNALVSTAIMYEIPMLLLVYYAGDLNDRAFSTVGHYTERVLQALEHPLLGTPRDPPGRPRDHRRRGARPRRGATGGSAADQAHSRGVKGSRHEPPAKAGGLSLALLGRVPQQPTPSAA